MPNPELTIHFARKAIAEIDGRLAEINRIPEQTAEVEAALNRERRGLIALRCFREVERDEAAKQLRADLLAERRGEAVLKQNPAEMAILREMNELGEDAVS